MIRGTQESPLPLLPSGSGGVRSYPLHEARSLSNHGSILGLVEVYFCTWKQPTIARNSYDEVVSLTIDLDREEDGRWIAEALELPGVMSYGKTRDEAISNTERLAIEVIADRIAHGELPSSALAIAFTIS